MKLPRYVPFAFIILGVIGVKGLLKQEITADNVLVFCGLVLWALMDIRNAGGKTK